MLVSCSQIILSRRLWRTHCLLYARSVIAALRFQPFDSLFSHGRSIIARRNTRATNICSSGKSFVLFFLECPTSAFLGVSPDCRLVRPSHLGLAVVSLWTAAAGPCLACALSAEERATRGPPLFRFPPPRGFQEESPVDAWRMATLPLTRGTRSAVQPLIVVNRPACIWFGSCPLVSRDAFVCLFVRVRAF